MGLIPFLASEGRGSESDSSSLGSGTSRGNYQLTSSTDSGGLPARFVVPTQLWRTGNRLQADLQPLKDIVDGLRTSTI